jgi:hypothetical protein
VLFLALITIASLLSVFVVHEAGHAFAARALGGSARVRWWPSPRTIAKLPAELSTRREALYFLAGPLANIGFAVVLTLGLGKLGALAGLMHAVFGAVSLLPTSSRNDGARAFALLKPR